MDAAARSARGECTIAVDESDVLATVSLNYVQPSLHSINEGVVTLAGKLCERINQFPTERSSPTVGSTFVRSDENVRTRTG